MVEIPFGLPLELCEIIFNYLSVKDLLKCALVSRAWSKYVGCNCMKKILIKIDNENAKDILQSERIYKRAKLIKLSKENVCHVIEFLSETVVDLEIEECEGHDNDKPLNLPYLKDLTFSLCSTDIFKNFDQKYDRLETLSLSEIDGSPSHVKRFFEINENIKELNLYMSDTKTCIFEDDSLVTDLNLHLKSIFISNKTNSELQSLTLVNIEKFIKAQGDRLEIISLINCANLLLLYRIWNSLKDVKKIYFFSTDPFFDYSDEEAATCLKKNYKITEIELHSLTPYPFSLEDIQPFLNACVNLKSLAVWQLRKDVLFYAQDQLKSLKNFSYVSTDDECQSYLKSKNGINDKLRFHQYQI